MNAARSIAVAVLLAALGAPATAGPGISRHSLESRGEHRTYYLLAPTGHETRPLVFLLHGTGGTGRELVEQWSALAQQERLILAAPTSTDPVGWRVPRDGPDLFRDLVEAVSGGRPVDRRRIYMVGYSAGGDAALFSSLAQSEYFAASAVLAASLRPRQYPLIGLAARRIPIIIFAATRDSAYPLRELRATRKAFEARGFPIEYSELQGRDHGYVGHSSDVVRRAWTFLQRHRLDRKSVV